MTAAGDACPLWTPSGFVDDNARNESFEDLTSKFVVTDEYLELLSPKNHVVLGARGSGKTALLRMLAHDHMIRVRDPRVEAVAATRKLIGLFVAMNAAWLSNLKKPYLSQEAADDLFLWYTNLSVCLSLLGAARSCLDRYVPDAGRRARTEQRIVEGLRSAWGLVQREVRTLGVVAADLEELQYQKERLLLARRARGDSTPEPWTTGQAFHAGLLSPMVIGTRVLATELGLPSDVKWMLCIDEAEFLNERQQLVVNTLMRSQSGNVAVKISTTPYGHHTLRTNVASDLSIGHDFAYIYVDKDPLQSWRDTEAFAELLFSRRVGLSEAGTPSPLHSLLDGSRLFDPKAESWGPDSPEMDLLMKYGTPETRRRARDLSADPRRFRDQISRKVNGPLLLYAAVETKRGRQTLDVYSGTRTVLRCADGNPRRMIQLLQRMLRECPTSKPGAPLSPKVQTRVLTTYARSLLRATRAEPVVGPQLQDLLERVGAYLETDFHGNALSTDQLSSIRVTDLLPHDTRTLVKRAVELGYLFPTAMTRTPEYMPETGVFRLAYALAPAFMLVPRRGKAVSLSRVLNVNSGPARPGQLTFGVGEGEVD